MADKKPTISEWVRDLRDKLDIPDNVSDTDVFRQIAEVDPSVLQEVQTVQPRGEHKAALEGGPVERYIKGLGGQVSDMFSRENITKMGISSSPFTDPDRSAYGTHPMVSALRHPIEAGKAITDLPGIAKAEEKGDYAGAGGRATTSALLLASTLFGAKGMLPKATGTAAKIEDLDEMLALGRSSLKTEGTMNAAKFLTRSQSAELASNLEGIQKAMSNRLINAQSLRNTIARPLKTLKGIERAPEAQVKGIAAAKEGLGRVETYAKRGMVPWQDAQNLYQELNNAEGGLGEGASQLRDELRAVREGLGKELQASAHAAGQGAQYDHWMKSYSKLSALQRDYVRTIKGMTPAQLEMKAGGPTGLGIPKTKIRIGNSQQKVARAEIKSWHKSLQDLDKQIKTKPAAPTTGVPPPPKPTGPPSPGGGGGVQAAPTAGGMPPKPAPPASGMGTGGPMGSSVDKVMGKQIPVSETQQAINDILKSMQPQKLPKNVVVGEEMGSTITQPGTGPAKVLQFPKPKPE